ncbi:M13-type metalloendopeptidase [Gordonia hongkongensis]|uniref:M13-type metalloendopeptidase n=2 Tax=Gordonia TaxID=2053 RepID=UPI000990FA21
MKVVGVGPRDDFYCHVNGDWIDQHVMPPNVSIDGSFRDAWRMAESRVRDTIACELKDTPVFTFWSAAMSASDPLVDPHIVCAEELQVVSTLREPSDLPRVLAELYEMGVTAALELTVRTEPILESGEKPNRLIVRTVPGETDDRGSGPGVAQNQFTCDDTQASALSLDLAHACRTRSADRTERVSVLDLCDRAPCFDWTGWLDIQGVALTEQLNVQVVDVEAVETVANALTAHPLAAVREWLRSRVIRCRYGQLRGGDSPDARLLACQRLTERFYAKEILERYRQRFVTESRVEQAMSIALDVRNALLEILCHLPLSDGGRRHLAEQIERVTIRVGLPEARPVAAEFRCSDNPYENVRNAFRTEAAAVRATRHWREAAAWDPARAYSATGYYHRGRGELLLPWGLLDEPFLADNGAPGASFGTFGCIVGHELAHSIDLHTEVDFGDDSQSTMTVSDLRRVAAWLHSLIDQSDKAFFDPMSRLEYAIDAGRALNEVFCDHLGVWAAAVATSHASPGQQAMREFFRGYATMMRSVATDVERDDRLSYDPHPPAEVRCNWVLRNLDYFHDAHATTSGDRMWVEPARRLCRTLEEMPGESG